jgi:hypothetical protein
MHRIWFSGLVSQISAYGDGGRFWISRRASAGAETHHSSPLIVSRTSFLPIDRNYPQ